MEAPPGPLRSPDGLWWWDGKSWQPIATLDAPPPRADAWQPPAEVAPAAPPAPAGIEAPSAGAWEPPPGIGQPAAADPPPTAVAPEPEQTAPSSDGWEVPGAASSSPGAWQPPGTASVAAPAPAAETASTAAEPVIPTAEEAAPPAPASAVPDSIWEPPPPPGQAPPPAPPPASDPPLAALEPPPAAAAPPPAPAVALPNWLPRSERSEAVLQGVPTRVDPAAINPPPAPGSLPPQVQIPPGARSSGWVSQLYPAGATINNNRRLVIYAGFGILGLIALYVLWQAVSGLNLFGGGTAGTTPDNSPTGTQFVQADGFLVGSLNPALASIASAEKPIPVDCSGAHSVTCRNTLEDADAAVVKAIAVIDKGPFPGCLAASVVQTRRDLVNLDQALKGALIGFRYNSDALVTKGLADFTAAAPTLKTDGDALKATQTAACPKTP